MIRSFPDSPSRSFHDNKMICSICYDFLYPVQVLNQTCPNGHVYHEDCMNEWLYRSDTGYCPTCRCPCDYQYSDPEMHDIMSSVNNMTSYEFLVFHQYTMYPPRPRPTPRAQSECTIC